MNAQFILRQLNFDITNNLFVQYEKVQARLSSNKKMKILFSDKQDWIPHISNGFKFTKHEIAFEKLSTDNVRNYDLVVPLTIQDLMFLNEERDLIDHNPIPIPSRGSILLCDDKYQFNQELVAKDFGHTIPKIGGALGHPFILKKKIDEWGKNSHIVYDSQQEQSLSALITDPEYFTQELITGPYEYATHILFKENGIACSINIEYYFETEHPIKGKDTSLYTKICRCPYLDLFASILTTIGFEGICCFNYKVRNNQPFIIEINPRFGGSLCPYFFSFIRHIS